MTPNTPSLTRPPSYLDEGACALIASQADIYQKIAGVRVDIRTRRDEARHQTEYSIEAFGDSVSVTVGDIAIRNFGLMYLQQRLGYAFSELYARNTGSQPRGSLPVPNAAQD